MRLQAILALTIASAPGVALAAGISGTITSTQGAGLAGLEVRLWGETPKGYVMGPKATTAGSGAYSFTNVPNGNYKVDCRMPNGMDGNWADRWYDRAPPTSSGYVEEDADVIVMGGTDVASIDISMESTGGYDGIVTQAGARAGSVQLRFENTADSRIHHNDISKGAEHGPENVGTFYFRGLEPGKYQLKAHVPGGNYNDLLVSGPFTVTNGANGSVGVVDLSLAPLDPHEPNNDTGVRDIDAGPLHQATPQEIAFTDARITPANEKDFYCFEARKGDRLLFSAKSTFIVPNNENPWVDPFLQVFSGDGATKLFEDDDGGPGGRDAFIDTGMVEQTARICVVVSTFGGQTGGTYELHLAMGNRAPSLNVTHNGAPVRQPPDNVVDATEDVLLDLDATFSDPEGGETIAATAKDAMGVDVTDAMLVRTGETATWSWKPSQTAAVGSPYTVHVEVTDGEFVRSQDVVVKVAAVNVAPSTPELLSPEDKTVVNTSTPGLTVTNSTDVDGNPLQYEFTLTYDDDDKPFQVLTIPEDASGQTTLTPEAIPENTKVTWSVRAFDGQGMDAYSPASMPRTFMVDVMNDPPSVPAIHKPVEAEVQMLRRPTVSVENPVDPEGDDVSIVFQVAKDSAFTSGLVESPPVPMETAGTTTQWTASQDLDWGGSYFVRARADDDRGGSSAFSDPVGFTIKDDAVPSGLRFGAPFADLCTNLVLHGAPPDQVELRDATDGDGEPVSIQLQIFTYKDNPDSGTPLYDQTKEQGAGNLAVFDISAVSFAEDGRYRIRARAGDGSDWGDWTQCDLTVDAKTNKAAKSGCGCGSGGEGSVLALLGLAGLLVQRRRRT